MLLQNATLSIIEPDGVETTIGDFNKKPIFIEEDGNTIDEIPLKMTCNMELTEDGKKTLTNWVEDMRYHDLSLSRHIKYKLKNLFKKRIK